MKKLMMVMVVACLCSASALRGETFLDDDTGFANALSSLTTIDFEGIAEVSGQAGAINLAPSYSFGNVTLTPGIGSEGLFVGIPDPDLGSDNAVNFYANDFFPTSGVACLSPDFTNNPAPIGTVHIEFTTPVDGVGGYFLDAETSPGNGSYIEAFDKDGISLGKLWLGKWPDNAQVFAGIVASGICSADLALGYGSEGVGLDDLTYGVKCTCPDSLTLDACVGEEGDPDYAAASGGETLLVPVGEGGVATVNFLGKFANGCDPWYTWNFVGGDDWAEDPLPTVPGGEIMDTVEYEPGVYCVSLTITDGECEELVETVQVIVYDPAGGFVTGGGWIDSPEGAYADDPLLTGKATFGFVSKYKKGASVPTGTTEFQFKAGDLNFHSSSYDWLVITGAGSNYAMFKGAGTINGAGDYKFMIWAGDKDPDTFRIKIWEGDEDDPVYDNGSDQEIGGGSIVIHSK